MSEIKKTSIKHPSVHLKGHHVFLFNLSKERFGQPTYETSKGSLQEQVKYNRIIPLISFKGWNRKYMGK